MQSNRKTYILEEKYKPTFILKDFSPLFSLLIYFLNFWIVLFDLKSLISLSISIHRDVHTLVRTSMCNIEEYIHYDLQFSL
jgi:hypothetical protein